MVSCAAEPQPSGQGTMTWQESGESYTGAFKSGFFHGVGVHTTGNGDSYTGSCGEPYRKPRFLREFYATPL